MDENFSTLESLYERLVPALKSKENELHKNHMIYITKQDIWNFCYNTKWRGGENLTLADLVNDILNSDNTEIDEFLRNDRKNKEEQN